MDGDRLEAPTKRTVPLPLAPPNLAPARVALAPHRRSEGGRGGRRAAGPDDAADPPPVRGRARRAPRREGAEGAAPPARTTPLIHRRPEGGRGGRRAAGPDDGADPPPVRGRARRAPRRRPGPASLPPHDAGTPRAPPPAIASPSRLARRCSRRSAVPLTGSEEDPREGASSSSARPSCAVLLASSLLAARAADPYRFYTWNVTFGDIYPLGVKQEGILINGQFPGPQIDAVTNDNINVNGPV
ncbi:hypothetical protein PVAP13_7KG392340 [Panicum virgatum]|uniref:Plastocyanin-like domain-containing protein n=1 Tax=Panicum virgatum TaxID=38727 RepID=A0A8T0QM12_PANVG|nr:hypothetical protein PVAP13_7KG392340 [Panicum virgatum]